ncbi:MAG: class I SAM-dependent RNA methyltransferase [Proteobacteria bacterium]|nr:class I SAM-dependent RNA methyltransferase [Pseudomonadota bacterium]
MYIYQETNDYFAQISDGLEELGADELKTLGASDVKPGFRGIHFTASQEILYRIVYNARLISRVLAPLVSFPCNDTDALYREAKKIKWSDFLSSWFTFAVFSNVSNSNINHSQFASLRLKDAIVDYFREKTGKRPNVDPKNPSVWFNLHIRDDRALISLDVSGGSLHKRGYRKHTVEAPIQETLGAAIIKMSGWDGSVPLIDPMCGSGTLLCEALMHHCMIPSGFLKKQTGVKFLPDYNEKVYKIIVSTSNRKIRSFQDRLIFGYDIAQQAVDAARRNANRIPGGAQIRFEQKNFKHIDKLENSVIVCNPPFGIRLKPSDDMGEFYAAFGDFLKQKCQGSTAYIYFGEREYIKHLGLKTTFKKEMKNGGLDGRLVKVELY